MKWHVIFEPQNLQLYLTGISTTLGLLLSSLAIGAVLALIFALALTSRWAVLRWIVGAYTYVIRGTPLLIQVCLDTAADATWAREVRALESAAASQPDADAMLITLDPTPPARELPGRLRWAPAAQWLLER